MLSLRTISSFLLNTFIVFGLLLLANILYKLFLLPLWTLRYYKSQGITTYFFPMMGIARRDRKFQTTTNDYFGYYKTLPQNNPNVRAMAGNIGSRVHLHILDPQLAKEVYNHPNNYKKNLAFKLIPAMLGTGLFLAEGDFWKAHRKVISSVFHFEFLKSNVGLIVDTTRELLDEVAKKCPQDVNLMGEIQNITGEIVGKIFFSENLAHYRLKGQPFTQYLGELASQIGILFKNPLFLVLFITGMKPEIAPKYKEFLAEINEFRAFCMKIVQDRKNANTGKKDLLGLLLETQKAANVEDRFSDEDIVNEFITFFFAGMDTTGHLMTVLLFLLEKNPEYLSKVEKEVEETYSKAETITTDTLNKMEYAHCVIKETLRMYNPTSTIFPRMALADHNIGDIKVKKGTMVKTVPVYNVFHEKYFDEPMKFKPERWLKKKENELDPFVYVPFSAGPRNCIGQHLAVISGKVIMAEFVKMFRFKTVPEDFELKMIFTSLYEPKDKIIMHLERK